ncbi:MAG: shikimate kinase [Bacteroidia bacterium]
MSKTIYLVGFMGAGKTTLGKEAARLLGWEFADLDHLIELMAGRNIPQIFESAGEAAFRQIERNALEQVANSGTSSRIVATGGGAPCYGDNMQLINQLGVSIYLCPTPEVLFERLRLQKDTRPMIREVPDEALEDHIRNLLARRETFYRQAHIVLEHPRLRAEVLAEIAHELGN